MKTRIISVTFVLLFVVACGLNRQINEMKNFANCEFRLKSVENTSIAKVNIQNVKSYSDLSIIDAGLLVSAVA